MSQLENTSQVVSRLKILGGRLPQRMRMAVRTEAELIMSYAKTGGFIPQDTRALFNSARVDMQGSNRAQAQARMSFSGPHAVAAHETPSKHDPPSWRKAGRVNFRVGGPKYLERPMRARIPGMSKRIGANLKLG